MKRFRHLPVLLLQTSFICLALELLFLNNYIWVALRHIELGGTWRVDAASDACRNTIPERHLTFHYIIFNTWQMVLHLVVLNDQTTNEMVVALAGNMYERLVMANVAHCQLIAIT